jgi:hydrogenase expression/formation protein HypC
MCLGIPGRVVRWLDTDGVFAKATVDFSGVTREVHMACVPYARVGQYVIVHAGVAICLVDENEASKTIAEFLEIQWNEDGDQ